MIFLGEKFRGKEKGGAMRIVEIFRLGNKDRDGDHDGGHGGHGGHGGGDHWGGGHWGGGWGWGHGCWGRWGS